MSFALYDSVTPGLALLRNERRARSKARMKRCKTGKRLLQGPNDRVYWLQVNVPCPVMTNRIGDPLLSGSESEGEKGIHFPKKPPSIATAGTCELPIRFREGESRVPRLMNGSLQTATAGPAARRAAGPSDTERVTREWSTTPSRSRIRFFRPRPLCRGSDN